MKLFKISGILLVALFSGQTGIALGAADAVSGAVSSKPQNKQTRKPAAKKVADQAVVRAPSTSILTATSASVPAAAATIAPTVSPGRNTNPYLTTSAPAAVPPAATPTTVAPPTSATTSSSSPSVGNPAIAGVNPYLAYAPPTQQANPFSAVSDSISKVGSALPSLGGSSDESMLPSIKKVYPTGEKPLVVVTFKCPIEMVGVKGGPTKILHDVVNLGMDAINTTNLLSFNLQQVCQ